MPLIMPASSTVATATGWDLSTAAYANKSVSVSSQTTTPTGVSFSTDGTKMYVTDDKVYQYTLSIPWDVSTATYASKNYDPTTQANEPGQVQFSSDGTKMYVLDELTDDVFQYTLSTPWDVSTGSYASKSFSATAQDTDPRSFAFNDTGSICYVMGDANNTVYQYTVGTPWDISTATYATKSFSVAGQTTTPVGVAFKITDGERMFSLRGNPARVFQYDLGTGFDVSTAVYNSVFFGADTQVTLASDIAFKPDGTKMYITDRTQAKVFQYDL